MTASFAVWGKSRQAFLLVQQHHMMLARVITLAMLVGILFPLLAMWAMVVLRIATATRVPKLYVTGFPPSSPNARSSQRLNSSLISTRKYLIICGCRKKERRHYTKRKHLQHVSRVLISMQAAKAYSRVFGASVSLAPNRLIKEL